MLNKFEEIYSIYLQNPQISTDTRKITSNCIFFALKGDNFDGNKFAQNALDLGAKYAIVDDESVVSNSQIILVENVLHTLQELAQYHRQKINIPIIALTGSNGKTTSKELIKSVLSKKMRVYATEGNLNNHIGVPLTLLSMDQSVEIGIVEMGANHQHEIADLCAIAQPNYGLITNIGKAHLEGFGGEEGVQKGKGELFDFLAQHKGVAMVNTNSEKIKKVASLCSFSKKITYGFDSNNDVEGVGFTVNNNAGIKWQSKYFKVGSQNIVSNLTGEYNAENILAAISFGLYFGLGAEDINKGISSYFPQNMRSQIKKTLLNELIIDTYNANPSSMEVAIENMNAAILGTNKVLILGDMFELGAYTDVEHQRIIHKVENSHIEKAFFVGKYFFANKKAVPNLFFFEDLPQLKSFLRDNQLQEKIILIKGSRGMKLETILELL